MEFFIAALPLLAVMFVMAAFCTFIVGIAFAHWFPVFLLASIDILWICQMITEPLSQQAFHLLFVGSITVSLVVVTCTVYLWKQAITQLAADARNGVEPQAAPEPEALPAEAAPVRPNRDGLPLLEHEVLLAPGERSIKIEITVTKD